MTTCSSFHTLDSEGSVIAELAADHKVETSNFLELIKLFAEYDLENDQNGKAKEEIEAVLPDASRVCQTPKTASSCCGNETNDLLVPGEVPLMVERLLRTGVCRSMEDFEFVPDKVSKEVAHLFADEKKEDEAEQDENVSHVKTGIWEVVTFEDDGTAKAPFYVVTGVSMTDRVDTKKLRKAIFKGQCSGRRPKLHLAPTSVGETLAGYKSGTMAPICHSKNMKLYLEETILIGDREHRILCGSGMFGKCLSIAEDKFMEVARSNSEGVELVSLIQKKKGIT
ncbi:expressed unknown protein [Seminavis robusta]|uniref:YbaK/aminoacyl-tRNA synthetase-associated domain-containing protein n=1 Tax=Seminavis robusta TaxID=568900 RepID=A0A9N8E316_9STRA|nr:expressed unknown protein [Seminavis robusta]|eukprot:Sro601_g173480.1 n/a (282) ;mRNA; r:16384-17229